MLFIICCCCPVPKSFPTPWNPKDCSMPGLPVTYYLPEFAQVHVSDAIQLILCHPLFLLPAIFPSIRVFSNESAFCIRRPSIGASASVLPINIQSGFILVLTSFISLLSKGLSRVFSSTSHHYILNGILDILILVSWFMQNVFSAYSEQMWNFKQLYSMDRGASLAAVHGVAKSQTRLRS